MTFTEYEKTELKSIVRENSRKLFENDYPDRVVKFIKSKGLTNQVQDFVRFPSMKHRKSKAENLELHFVMDTTFDLKQVLEEFGEILTLPYGLNVDCSFLIENLEGELNFLQYVLNGLKIFKVKLNFVGPKEAFGQIRRIGLVQVKTWTF